MLVPTSALLTMRLMPGIPKKEGKGSDWEKENELSKPFDDKQQGEVNQEQVLNHATTFTAEVHAEFFLNIMKRYKVILEEWAFFQDKLLYFLHCHFITHTTLGCRQLQYKCQGASTVGNAAHTVPQSFPQ